MSKSSMRAKERKILREELIKRDGTRCHYCGIECTMCQKNQKVKTRITIEHLIPKTNGGTNKLSNLVISCHGCNQERGFLTDPNRRA